MDVIPRDVELIVGIPTYMEADSIGFVVEQVDLGLATYLSDRVSIIVNADNNSEDDTRGAFLSRSTRTPKLYLSTPEGVHGKGNNLRTLFEAAIEHRETLRGVVVVDGDLRSISPEWVFELADPILRGFDYALPLYSRHQFDGTITNHICYPLVYALLDHDLRQPIGGEFAFSPALMEHWLAQDWIESTRHYGIDVFMTGHAVTGGFRICEVGLGAKIHKASAPKLGPMFIQVISTLFDLLLDHRPSWAASPVARPQRPPRFGKQHFDPPQQLTIDIRQMKEQLRAEFLPLRSLLADLLDEYSMGRLRSMFEQDYYDVDILMWTQIVYRLLYLYDRGPEQRRREVVEALRPLYFARSVAYDYLTWRYSVIHAEAAIAEQARAFAAQKPYLLGLYLSDAATLPQHNVELLDGGLA